MTSRAELEAAEAKAAIAHAQLAATMGKLKQGLDPRVLARKTARDVAGKGTAAAAAGANAIRRNPAITAGVAAAAGLFLARRKIAGLFRRG